MKELSSYIQEDLDAENMQWKVDNWKRQCNPEQLTAFNDLCKNSKNAHDIQTFKELVDKANIDFKSLVDSVNDNVDGDNVDYVYLLKKILDSIK